MTRREGVKAGGDKDDEGRESEKERKEQGKEWQAGGREKQQVEETHKRGSKQAAIQLLRRRRSERDT